MKHEKVGHNMAAMSSRALFAAAKKRVGIRKPSMPKRGVLNVPSLHSYKPSHPS